MNNGYTDARANPDNYATVTLSELRLYAANAGAHGLGQFIHEQVKAKGATLPECVDIAQRMIDALDLARGFGSWEFADKAIYDGFNGRKIGGIAYLEIQTI